MMLQSQLTRVVQGAVLRSSSCSGKLPFRYFLCVKSDCTNTTFRHDFFSPSFLPSVDTWIIQHKNQLAVMDARVPLCDEKNVSKE